MMGPSAGEPDVILERLDIDREALLAAAERVPAQVRAERPEPDRWSTLEVLEHVANVDGGVAKIIARCGSQPLTATAEELRAAQLTDERASWVRERPERVVAPERVQPKGDLTMDQVLEHLASARAALKQAYLSADPAVLDGAVFPHPFIGPITVRGWVELSGHHDARHARQIDEIAAVFNGR